MRERNAGPREDALAQRRACEQFPLDEPVAKCARRACICLNGACLTRLAGAGWPVSQRGYPAPHGLLSHLAHEMQMTLAVRILLQISKHHLMPFQGFGEMPHFSMSLQILLDGSF